MFVTSSVLLALASLVAAQGVTVNYPTLSQCSNSQISFSESSGPYYVAIVPAADPCNSDSYAEFYDVYGTSVDYYVNLPEGTQVIVYVVDASGTETFSDPYSVGGGDGSCLGNVSNDSGNQGSTDNYYQGSTDNSDQGSSDQGSTDNTYQQQSSDNTGVDPASDNSGNDAPVVVTTSTPVVVTATEEPDDEPTSTHQLSMTYSVDHSSDSSDDSTDDSNPVNAASNPDDASGATSATISVATIAFGAITAFAALL